MKRNAAAQIEQCRVTTGRMASTRADGNNGAFIIGMPSGDMLQVIASDGTDWQACELPGDPWEHVSVSAEGRMPTWLEMDHIKRLFWRDDETVMQLHVPRNQHVNIYDTCLHLWRPTGQAIPLPPLPCV